MRNYTITYRDGKTQTLAASEMLYLAVGTSVFLDFRILRTAMPPRTILLVAVTEIRSIAVTEMGDPE